MIARTVLVALLFATATVPLRAEPSPAEPAIPKLPRPGHLAPLKERLTNAKSVKVKTAILGVALNSPLETAHAKLDPLCDRAHPAKEESQDGEKEEAGAKVLWQLAGTDYSSIFVKTDEQRRITYILALLRPGKEIPFTEIGETEKAPICTDRLVAWDVLRPSQPLIRVVAEGAGGKAKTITLFTVKRPAPVPNEQRK